MIRDSTTLPSGSVEARTSDGRISDAPVVDVIDAGVVTEESDDAVGAETVAEEAESEGEVTDALFEAGEIEETLTMGQLDLLVH